MHPLSKQCTPFSKLRLRPPNAASGVRVVGTQALPQGYRPMLLRSGMLVCLTPAGSLASVALDTHAPLQVKTFW